NELPEELANMIQQSVAAKYRQMLQTLRDAWVFQDHGVEAWHRMDFSMTKMKQLAHSAEEIAENGIEPDLTPGVIDQGQSFDASIDKAVNDLKESLDLHIKLQSDKEAKKHGGLMSNLDLTIRQEKYEAEELQDLQKKR
ncbi:MAG: hypothetical protein ACOC0W_07730, partial [Desulfosalsimonas sp.]